MSALGEPDDKHAAKRQTTLYEFFSRKDGSCPVTPSAERKTPDFFTRKVDVDPDNVDMVVVDDMRFQQYIGRYLPDRERVEDYVRRNYTGRLTETADVTPSCRVVLNWDEILAHVHSRVDERWGDFQVMFSSEAALEKARENMLESLDSLPPVQAVEKLFGPRTGEVYRRNIEALEDMDDVYPFVDFSKRRHWKVAEAEKCMQIVSYIVDNGGAIDAAAEYYMQKHEERMLERRRRRAELRASAREYIHQHDMQALWLPYVAEMHLWKERMPEMVELYSEIEADLRAVPGLLSAIPRKRVHLYGDKRIRANMKAWRAVREKYFMSSSSQ